MIAHDRLTPRLDVRARGAARRDVDELVDRELAARDDGARPWLTLEQAAERLGCSRDAVRMRAKRGRYEVRHVGRRVYVSRDSVDGVT
jgi:excisionase family DNA binding protein